jgi:poly(3-hydroxybutyrate) depolymerase
MKLKAYAQAAHFGPTMLITAISFLLSTKLWSVGPASVIAFTVFLGQLIIGWSNDIYDYNDDVKHNRTNKPLVAGDISLQQLRRATFLLTPIAVIANLAGPLGIKGGSVYLLGVGCGIAYNFYFKFSPLSPLPYAVACAALPASIFYAIDRTPPLWVLAVGAMLGVAFHFVNVLKDLAQDIESSIGGLPQRIGKRGSFVIALILVVGAAVIFINSPVAKDLTSIEFTTSASEFTVGGDRPTLAILPTGYDEDVPAPLLIDLHGYSGTSLSQAQYLEMNAAAQARGVIYAAPDGLPDSQGNQFWNAFKVCCNFDGNPVDDVEFIQSLIDEISNKASVDPKRIYLFGHSNGHFMTYKFACSRPETVAAIAGLAGAMDSDADSCVATSPVNVLHIHGTSDETINYTGGSLFGNFYTGAADSVRRWTEIDKCLLTPIPGPNFDFVASIQGFETISSKYSCPEASVELWSIENGTHGPLFNPHFGLKVIDWFLAHPKK